MARKREKMALSSSGLGQQVLILPTRVRLPVASLMATNNEGLIKELRDLGVLKTEKIAQALRKIKREEFVPKELISEAYFDEPVVIGWGQTISQPYTVVFMLELLKVEEGNRILDIGAGSGWQSALLADLCGMAGKVYAIERIPELCMFGQKNLDKYGLRKSGRVEWICGDGSEGLPEYQPYDRIVAAAAAVDVSKEWIKQLKFGGRLVLPVQNEIWLMVKKSEKQIERERFSGFSFVSLIRKGQK